MLKKKFRGMGESDFTRLFSDDSSVFRSGPITLRIVRTENESDPARFSVVIGVKVEKSAVVRNTCKRRARAVFASIQKTGKVPHGYLVAAFLFAGVQKMSFSEMKKQMEVLFGKAFRISL